VQGHFDHGSEPKTPLNALRVLSGRQAHFVRFAEQSLPTAGGHLEMPHPDDPQLAARLALRTDAPIEAHASALQGCIATGIGSAQERALAVARLYQATGIWYRDLTNFTDLPSDLHESMLMANERYTAFLSLPVTNDASAVRRMTLLVWLAETQSDLRDECHVRGQSLVQNWPRTDGLSALLSRLTRGGEWSRVKQLSASAGVREMQWTRWLPESPSLRVRTALATPLDPDERLLVGRQSLVLSMRNLRPTQLAVSLSPATLGYLPMQPVRLACQQSDRQPQWFTIKAAGETQHTHFDLPVGSQFLRLWIDQPIANHYVRVAIREPARSDNTTSSAGLNMTRRFYDVATSQEPIKLVVDGPAWLRIDQLRDDTTCPRYVAVLEPRREIELTPQEGRAEALYRIFKYQVRDASQSLPTHWVQVPAEPVPEPLVCESWWDTWSHEPYSSNAGMPGSAGKQWLTSLAVLSPDAPVMAMDVYDPYPLEDPPAGTWSVALGVFERRPLEEGLNGSRPGRFLETRATRYLGNACGDVYHRTDLLTRARDRSGPTLGLLHRSRWDSDWWPIQYELISGTYVQKPAGAVGAFAGSTEWSTTLRGRVLRRRQINEDLYHTLRLSVFGRVLSQDRNEYLAGLLDQDIFTSYKADHLTGLTLSDTWVYQRRIDTRWWARPSLVTNEDYNPILPDQFNFRCGLEQALRRAELAASYRLTWFLSDHDRRRDRLQNLLYVDLLTDIPWCGRAAELLLRVQHDLDRGSASAQVSLAYYLDRGYLDRDRWPGERSFVSLRNQHAVARRSAEGFYP
jgi:hypothetical protein